MIHRRLRGIIAARHLNARSLEAFAISSVVNARILFPPAAFSAATADDQALVVQLSVESAKILFTSDAGSATENWLLQHHNDLRSDVLIKGQHHSGKSGTDAFLDAVRPQLIVATAREFPQQERISEEWAARVRSRGIRLFRQDETGAVELAFYSQNWRARSYLTGETFRRDKR